MVGKAIIVTGANGGIGFSITQQLLAKPAETVALVVAIDLHDHRLRCLLDRHQDRLEVVCGDISRRESSQKAVDAAISRAGRLDSIILNAGIQGPTGSILKTDVEAWKKCFDVNFFSLVHSIQVAAPHLHESKGSIIMTTSGVSLSPFPEWGAYGSSKAAMNYLNMAWPKEDQIVRSVCIRPGIVDTGLQKEVRDELQNSLPEKTYTWLKGIHDRGELLRPDQPARTFVAFALGGIPEELTGKVVDWNDPKITHVR
ncbi:uncharacterized protein Z520_00769 [Fonsecaea multimorphosa CBS 102226]|uniref:NAD-dependent epimerase/dehydratase domain-containing protein n=1 Tax=Fonsecaea multimorphosa CBS 102226 TaxID=1442371 RepID=A0A0D2J3V1_9EURO|nr:uncharacterized protein Z520_00769 [Fonsecaea multimorphosa CBS 102226]KIY04077.1 hypothetical protein Z520_00769 [Fonsecaea multimorphosa CBS 102226]OAL31911.1 hypothetical protein AYO22_00781 [Fonsecaea multimorphosa]